MNKRDKRLGSKKGSVIRPRKAGEQDLIGGPLPIPSAEQTAENPQPNEERLRRTLLSMAAIAAGAGALVGVTVASGVYAYRYLLEMLS